MEEYTNRELGMMLEGILEHFKPGGIIPKIDANGVHTNNRVNDMELREAKRDGALVVIYVLIIGIVIPLTVHFLQILFK